MATDELLARKLKRDYIEVVRRETGLDYTNIARRAGKAPTTLTRFMNDDEHPSSPSRATLEAIASRLRIPLPPELVKSIGVGDALPPGDAQMSQVAERVPVFSLYGSAGGASDGDYVRNERPGDAVPRPPGIAHNTSCYAVRMPDDSMTPWRRANELMFVDPSQRAGAGDYALVEMPHPTDADHPRSLYRVRRIAALQRDGSVRAERHNPEETETIPRVLVLALHRILPWQEVAIR